MSQYRDPLAAIREQIDTKRSRIEDLMQQIVPVLWALATPAERDELRSLRGQGASAGADFAALTVIDSALDALSGLLERLIAPAKWFEGDWPEAAPMSGPLAGVRLSEELMFEMHEDLEVRAARLLGASSVETVGGGFQAKGTFGRVPVLFKTIPVSSEANDYRSSLRIRIAIPCSLTFSPMTFLGDAVGTAMVGARVRGAIERLRPRAGAAYVLDQEAKIAWTSDDRTQLVNPIPLEAMGALAALYVEAMRIRVG